MNEPTRPSDELLIQTIADAFKVSYETAYFWLMQIELSTKERT